MRWKPRTGRVQVMGVLNVTPDSFSDGGRYLDPEDAFRRAERMVDEGADIIDVGGESTRPFSEPVPPEMEVQRVVPVIRRICESLDVPVSVDTYKPEVASAAIDAGACVLNDVFALRKEGMLEVAAERGVPVVLMHMKGTPKTMQENVQYNDVVAEIKAFLEERISAASSAGISEVVADPGIGFGKLPEHNLEILRRFEEFRSLGVPLLVGCSRKSFIGHVLDLPVEERLEGTLAANAVVVMKGADIIRVHDVKENVRMLRVLEAVGGFREDQG